MATMRLLLAALAIVFITGCTSDAHTGTASPEATTTPDVTATPEATATPSGGRRPDTRRYASWWPSGGPAVDYDVPEGLRLETRGQWIGVPTQTGFSEGVWLEEVESGSRICVGRSTKWATGGQDTNATYVAYECGRQIRGQNAAEIGALFDELAKSIRLSP